MKYEIMNEKEVVEKKLGLILGKTFEMENELLNYVVGMNEE